MANSYTCIHIQFVFCVKYRKAMITGDYEEELFKYMIGALQAHGHKMVIIKGLPDHVHILAGVRPNESNSDICEYMKSSSSKWINENKLTPTKFNWQRGYGAFSYSISELPNIIHYIEMQKLTHESISFKDEYESLLNEYQIEFDQQYVSDYFPHSG